MENFYETKTKIFNKVKNTSLDLFATRKYTITTENDEYDEPTSNSIHLVIAGITPENKSVCVYISFGKTGKEKTTKFLKGVEHDHIILISQEVLTSQAKKCFEEIPHLFTEFFLIKQMVFNILKHSLQPRFTLLKREEIKQLLDTLQCSLSDLPKLSVTDPISRFYNAPIKSVFKIDRKTNVYYRVVI
jgi:DNA-directed RNA polymerase subunit H (RpoH/RPB5)